MSEVPQQRATGKKGDFDYLDLGRWWDRPAHQSGLMQRGFVGNSRFAGATEPVIPRTSGAVKRRNRSAK